MVEKGQSSIATPRHLADRHMASSTMTYVRDCDPVSVVVGGGEIGLGSTMTSMWDCDPATNWAPAHEHAEERWT